MGTYKYLGQELAIFGKAVNWKSYLYDWIKPYLFGVVLEVGAGIGETTKALTKGVYERWVCLEPDMSFNALLESKIEKGCLPSYCESILGKVSDLPQKMHYSTILYLDVMEHIKDDKLEFAEALSRTKRGGYLIILSPAYQKLFSDFDRAVGHYRRYNRRMMKEFRCPNAELVCLRYLDSVGLGASFANSILLRRATPSEKQIFVWDKCMIPLSRVLDPILCHSVGRSILGVWKVLR
jgi:SAM-dependent methyltransferase